MPKITPFYRWYDLWIGAYVDRENKTVYICPVPTLGLKIERGRFTRKHFCCTACGFEWNEKVRPDIEDQSCKKCYLRTAYTEIGLKAFREYAEAEHQRLVQREKFGKLGRHMWDI